MKKSFLLIVFLTFGMNANASLKRALKIYHSEDKAHYPELVSELVQEKMYFSSIPFIKEYLATTTKINDNAVDKVIDQMIGEVGIRQFEMLPSNILEKSRAPAVLYILAKKAFRQGQYERALKYLDKISDSKNSIRPFTLLLEGSIYSILKKEDQAIKIFRECIDVADFYIKKEKDQDRIRQLKINRDYCIVGIPRSQFSQGKFDAAYSSYLDLEKTSYIWPEILFEEAWNSFYLKDYNRTLGKLVTYKAPVFTSIFNPEIDVLKALSFMELCLWEDSKKIVESFYERYEKNFESYKKTLESMGKDYKQYYSLVRDYAEGKTKRDFILNTALASMLKDPAYLELHRSFVFGRDEMEKIKSMESNTLTVALNENLRESINLQQNLIGSYIRRQLHLNSAQIIKAFEDMSYIKLEILSKRKTEIYDDVPLIANSHSRSRGNISHVMKTDKQYVWNFNGEFWADELGDYVFSLKSECR